MIAHRDPTRPFFLQVGYHRPHSPYNPPLFYFDQLKNETIDPPPHGGWTITPENKIVGVSEWNGKIDDKLNADMRRAYYASINHVDNEIGKIFHYLGKNKLLHNTFVIILSDHGDMMGDHYYFRKAVPFEGAARIPFVIFPPYIFNCKRGQVNHIPVTRIDILPTLLEIAGIKPAEKTDGISLVSSITDGTENARYIHGEHANPHLSDGWQYLVNGKEKYIYETMSGQEYYFDLTSDPKELHNAINDKDKQSNIDHLRNSLIEILKDRSQDRLVKDGKLTSQFVLPCFR